MDNIKSLHYPIVTVMVISLIGYVLLTASINNGNLAYSTSGSSSLGQSIQQFQENLQSAINKQVQSSANNKTCNNSYSVQTQTNDNGIIKSITKSSCDGSILTSNNLSDNFNLKGIIMSAEHDLKTGNIIRNVFGNWSFLSHNGTQEFKSSFTISPISENLTNSKISHNGITNVMPIKNNSAISTYDFSNFKMTSMIQQNSDRSFTGNIDIVKNIMPSKGSLSSHVYNYKNIPITISILGEKTLIISFDKKENLFNEFNTIPIVGLIE